MYATAMKLPLIIVLGATGTGKSKLAIELAKKVGGEIISADSMQVYKGLDIITNKVTKEERKIVPHHIIDCLDPLCSYTVVDFRNAALPLIRDMKRRGQIPIIVGGTNYYIESVLWEVLVSDECVINKKMYNVADQTKHSHLEDAESCISNNSTSNTTKNTDSGVSISGTETIKCDSHFNELNSKINNNGITNINDPKRKCKNTDYELIESLCSNFEMESTESNEELYSALQKVDPEVANSYHPNNRRKIIRSLQVWHQTGQRHSDIVKKQCEDGGSDLGGPLRFPGTVIFWIHCEQDVLSKRLDERVDSMIEAGLLKELQDFHTNYNEQFLSQEHDGNYEDSMSQIVSVPDTTDVLPEEKTEPTGNNSGKVPLLPSHYTKGIFQSIGFKEFHKYLILPPSERDSTKGQALYEEGINKLKLVTQRYSRKQLKWLRKRFNTSRGRQIPVLYKLDGTELNEWDNNVRLPAEDVIDSIINDGVPKLCPYTFPLNDESNQLNKADKTKYFCDVCNRILIGEYIWNEHIIGNKHKKMVKLNNHLNNVNKEELEERPSKKLHLDNEITITN